METRFVDDDTARAILLSVTEEFTNCYDDDWWTGIHVYDVNVWWCDEDNVYRVTLYKHTEEGLQTGRWQSLGVINKQQYKGETEMSNEEYTVTPVEAFPKPTVEELQQELEQLRRAYGYVDANRNELASKLLKFRGSINKFIRSLANDDLIEEDDDCVMEHLDEWIENGTLDNPFMQEYTFLVTVETTKTYRVTVEARNMSADDVADAVETAFADADGDGDDVDTEPVHGMEMTHIDLRSDTVSDIDVEEQ